MEFPYKKGDNTHRITNKNLSANNVLPLTELLDSKPQRLFQSLHI